MTQEPKPVVSRTVVTWVVVFGALQLPLVLLLKCCLGGRP